MQPSVCEPRSHAGHRLVGLNERGVGLDEPGNGGGCRRAPGSGGGRLGELGCVPSFACGAIEVGRFDGLCAWFGLGGGESAFVVGSGGLPLAIGPCALWVREPAFACSGRGGLGAIDRGECGLAGTSSRPPATEGGRCVTGMYAPDLG